jgi:hypothetical protein
MKFSKHKIIVVLITILFCFYQKSFAQNKIEPFPPLKGLVTEEFQNSNNLFPIAYVNVTIGNKPFRIPITYSLLFYPYDSSHFQFKGDYIDSYSFQILNNGISKPMFKKEAILISKEKK